MTVTPTAPKPSLGVIPPRLITARALDRIEVMFDHWFGPRLNPWRHLGALGFWLFWIVAASGIYVYAVFDTSASGAYRSVEYMTREQWYAAGLMRSLHRYASDAFVLMMLLHLVQEWIRGHAKGFRWFSWVTGVLLIGLAYASGIGGYWLVWDELAQFSLIATTEWLDWLPIFGDPLTRNFLAPESVGDRFFSLLIFLHIGIPLALLAGMWIHIQRISRPVTNPPRLLAWGTVATLVGLSLAYPATSHAPADLARVPAALDLDWFYLFFHPLQYATSVGTLWALAAAATLLLLVLPWMPKGTRMPIAQVNLANCNGCGRCFDDCPYAAVIMEPRPGGRPQQKMPVVLTDLCAGCGICAGACPSSTPFRSIAELATGIDLPQLPITKLREQLEQRLSALRLGGHLHTPPEEGLPALGVPTRVVVFGCDCAVDVRALADPDTAVLSLVCTAQLPPSFIEYAVRGGADGVLVTGCQSGSCEYRLGNRWVEARIAGAREPHLRVNVPRERVQMVWAGPLEQDLLVQALAQFRAALAALDERHRPRALARAANV
jgi:coenzyme F420-reducing hydrogenase delta subunit/quinol-cytochrome oxidoreductase complex cytochrome b subunit/NAD-dependent dihydropyrimidine dehydrogenase PreA subunit